MKSLSTLVLVLGILISSVAFPKTAYSQCNYLDEGAFGTSSQYNSIICWQFARAYLKKNPSGGTTLPTVAEMNAESSTNGNFCTDEDSNDTDTDDFVHTTDPGEADIVVWGGLTKVAHVAVSLGNGRFISKDDSRSSIDEHDLCIAAFGKPSAYYTFRNRKLGIPGATNCPCHCDSFLTIDCTEALQCVSGFTGTINSSIPLSNYNYVSSAQMYVNISSNCDYIYWSQYAGSGVWYAYNSGKGLTLYLTSGQSITLKARDKCNRWSRYISFTNTSKSASNIELSGEVYPNPFNDQIRLSESLSGKKMMLFDTNGRLIREVTYSTKPIDLSGLKSGVYLLDIFHPDSQERTIKKLIKN